MNTPAINRYKHHRFPVEIISHAVWLYFRFCLSYRDVEELLFGLTAANAGKFTVATLAETFSFKPGRSLVRNSWKIKTLT